MLISHTLSFYFVTFFLSMANCYHDLQVNRGLAKMTSTNVLVLVIVFHFPVDAMEFETVMMVRMRKRVPRVSESHGIVNGGPSVSRSTQGWLGRKAKGVARMVGFDNVRGRGRLGLTVCN